MSAEKMNWICIYCYLIKQPFPPEGGQAPRGLKAWNGLSNRGSWNPGCFLGRPGKGWWFRGMFRKHTERSGLLPLGLPFSERKCAW